MNTPTKCRVCGVYLTEANWYPSYKRGMNRICKTCHNEQRRMDPALKQATWQRSDKHRCRVCGIELTDGAWYPSYKRGMNRICITCATEQRKRVRFNNKACFTQVDQTHCRVCHIKLTDANWVPSDREKHNNMCLECYRRYGKHARARRSNTQKPLKRQRRPMNENWQCALFLGVHVAERVLSKVFRNVERMPMHNPGYDFICNRGKKIDVKSSCLNKDIRWAFKIDRNTTADLFLLIAFNDRYKLTPKHLWLIPGAKVSHARTVSTTPSAVSKWDEYEIPIDPVVNCCKELLL